MVKKKKNSTRQKILDKSGENILNTNYEKWSENPNFYATLNN